MKIRAAVLEHTGGRQLVQELDLAPPGPGEVLVRLGASGVCRSDYNAIDGTTESPCPVVLGHEGAGVVELVGPRVRRVAPGDQEDHEEGNQQSARGQPRYGADAMRNHRRQVFF